MKKIILALLVAFMAFGASASDSTGKALTMRTAVKTYLTTEGYAPKIDSDGDLQFKYQGATYYISFENWRSQVYVKVFSLLDTDGATVSRVRKAADEAQNEYKFIRCNVNSKSVSFNIPMSVSTSSQITSLLDTFMEIISDAKAKCKDVYNDE